MLTQNECTDRLVFNTLFIKKRIYYMSKNFQSIQNLRSLSCVSQIQSKAKQGTEYNKHLPFSYSSVFILICYHVSDSFWAFFFFFLHFIYFQREEGREKVRERNMDVGENTAAFCKPPSGYQARNQACALTENGTSSPWFPGQHSIHWATLARAHFKHFAMSPWTFQKVIFSVNPILLYNTIWSVNA